jgi:hypothetical protein
VWEAFWNIEARARPNNGYAYLPIPPSEVESWCRLHGETFTPWELDLLDVMEAARLEWLNRKDEPKPLTPDTFKSMFGK